MIGIVNTGSGNIDIYKYIFQKLDEEHIIVNSPEDLKKTNKIFLPGIGSIDHSVAHLRQLNLFEPLKEWLFNDKPSLCVCLGFQMLFESSEEGKEAGFGVLQGKVKMFQNVITPRIEWGFVDWNNFESPNASDDERFYFVHSFFAPIVEETICIANYGVDYSAGIKKGNIWGFQFHPEKSHEHGLGLIREFLVTYEAK